MGMRVDEAGRDDKAAGVDLTSAGDTADRSLSDDAIAGNREIGPEARRSGAVDDRAVANDGGDLAHDGAPLGGWCLRQCSAISIRRQIHTRSWRRTWSRNRAKAAARPGLPARRQWSATV